jgi:hypothetical protein
VSFFRSPSVRPIATAKALALLIFLVLVLSRAAQAARLALVIGNDSYRNVEPLKNAGNDAQLMASVLRDAGFEIVGGVRQNLDRDALGDAVDALTTRIGADDEVVFYFAGHGVQMDSGAQLLLPVDVKAGTAGQVNRDGLPLPEVQQSLARARFALLVIDACRNDPFKPEDGRARAISASRGLKLPTQAELVKGSVLLLAANYGERALDYVPGPNGTEKNGLFTYKFVSALQVRGRSVVDAIRDAREQVDTLARAVGNPQTPVYADAMRGDFVLFPDRGPAIPALPSATAAAPALPQELASVREQSKKEAEERERWNAWLKTMQTVFEQLTQADSAAAKIDQIEAWQQQTRAWAQFQTDYARNNPFSRNDEEWRKRAVERQQAAERRVAFLQDEAKKHAEWAAYQTRMQTAFEQAAADAKQLDEQPDLQAKIWAAFLKDYAADNPQSKDDEALRQQARAAQQTAYTSAAANARKGELPPEKLAGLSSGTQGSGSFLYQVVGDGSEIKDMNTGLIWRRCSEGQSWDGTTCTGEAMRFTWSEAQTYAQSQRGWRMPIVQELARLRVCSTGWLKTGWFGWIEKTQDDLKDGGRNVPLRCADGSARPTLDVAAFPGTPDTKSGSYWTASLWVGDPTFSWHVYFGNGNTDSRALRYKFHVRLVR